MSVLNVVKLFDDNLYVPYSCLRQPCADVEANDLSADWFKCLIRDMFETLYACSSGVGLAANQVGVMKRVLVVDLKRDAKKPIVMCNPKYEELDGETFISNEVCMSFPNMSAGVYRFKRVKVSYQSINGEFNELTAEGFLSSVYQHEIDHLFGKAYIDSAVEESGIVYYSGYPKRMAEKSCECIFQSEQQEET